MLPQLFEVYPMRCQAKASWIACPVKGKHTPAHCNAAVNILTTMESWNKPPPSTEATTNVIGRGCCGFLLLAVPTPPGGGSGGSAALQRPEAGSAVQTRRAGRTFVSSQGTYQHILAISLTILDATSAGKRELRPLQSRAGLSAGHGCYPRQRSTTARTHAAYATASLGSDAFKPSIAHQTLWLPSGRQVPAATQVLLLWAACIVVCSSA